MLTQMTMYSRYSSSAYCLVQRIFNSLANCNIQHVTDTNLQSSVKLMVTKMMYASTYKSGDRQEVIPCQSFGKHLCPDAERDKDYWQNHECDGQANHHVFCVVVIHGGCSVNVRSLQRIREDLSLCWCRRSALRLYVTGLARQRALKRRNRPSEFVPMVKTVLLDRKLPGFLD